MKAVEKIEKGISLETECLPFEAEEFDALINAPADQCTPRELRLMATVMVIASTNQEAINSLSEELIRVQREYNLLKHTMITNGDKING